jgi:hypothetical protein
MYDTRIEGSFITVGQKLQIIPCLNGNGLAYLSGRTREGAAAAVSQAQTPQREQGEVAVKRPQRTNRRSDWTAAQLSVDDDAGTQATRMRRQQLLYSGHGAHRTLRY